MNKQQANNPFYKEGRRREQERLARENSRWKSGSTSSAALRFANADDAALLSKKILIKVPLLIASCPASIPWDVSARWS